MRFKQVDKDNIRPLLTQDGVSSLVRTAFSDEIVNDYVALYGNGDIEYKVRGSWLRVYTLTIPKHPNLGEWFTLKGNPSKDVEEKANRIRRDMDTRNLHKNFIELNKDWQPETEHGTPKV